MGVWDMFPSMAVSQAAGSSGSPAGAAASAGLGIFQNIMSGINARKANKRMVDFWKMNNQYNHPTAQMARLREAGLNPALMYGQSAAGATGSSPAAPKAQGPTPVAEISNPLASFQNLRMQEAQYDNLRAQNDLLIQDKILKTLEARKRELGNQRDKTTLQYLDRMLDADTSYKRTRSDLELNKWKLSQSEISFLYENQDVMDKYLNSKFLQGFQNLSNSQKLERLRELEIEIKEELRDFTRSNQVISLLSKLVGMIPR